MGLHEHRENSEMLDEAEFILDDKDVLLASPRRMKINNKRGGIIRKVINKRKIIKCHLCSLVFNNQQILDMHKKVCGYKSAINQDEKKINVQMQPYEDVDLKLLSILNKIPNNDNECLKKLLEGYFNLKLLGELGKY